MNIVLICNEYPPAPHGGIGTFVYNLARQLVMEGHHVHVIGFDPRVAEKITNVEAGVIVSRLRSPYAGRWYLHWGNYDIASHILNRIYLSRWVKKYCRLHGIELVESYDWSGPLIFHPDVPLLVRMHGAHSAHAFYEKKKASRFLSLIEKRNLSIADALVGVSEHISALTLQATGLLGKNYTVIYNGVDTSVFRPMKDTKKSPKQILFAGTVSRRKGVYELFHSMSFVFEKVPSAQLLLVGRLPVDEMVRQSFVNELLSTLRPEYRKQVTFTDAMPYSEMPVLYNRAACAVFPSLAEAYGLTCAEAMACGTPVVMTSRASGPEIVENGVSGFLCEPSDSQSLAQALISLLSDGMMRERMGKNAVMQVRQKFDSRVSLRQNLAFYQKMLS